MEELNREYVRRTLGEERLWKVGESDTFSFKNWELKLEKESDVYKPFTYSVVGKNVNGSGVSVRYRSMEKAFLHIVNNFNDNANVSNRYNSIEDFIKEVI